MFATTTNRIKQFDKAEGEYKYENDGDEVADGVSHGVKANRCGRNAERSGRLMGPSGERSGQV